MKPLRIPTIQQVKKFKVGQRKPKPKVIFQDSTEIDQCFFLPGKIVSLNEMLELANYAFHFRGVKNNEWAKAKKKIEQKFQWQFVLQGVQPMGKAWFFITYQEENKRRDKDNIAGVAKKVIFDALVGANLLPNDGWGEIVKWDDEFEIKKKDPGILVRMIRPGTPEGDARIRYKVIALMEAKLKEQGRLHPWFVRE